MLSNQTDRNISTNSTIFNDNQIVNGSQTNSTLQLISNVTDSNASDTETSFHKMNFSEDQVERKNLENGMAWLYYYCLFVASLIAIVFVVIWLIDHHLKKYFPKKRRRFFNWDEETRFGEPTEIVFGPLVLDESTIPLQPSPIFRDANSREILSDSQYSYINRYSTEPRKRSFEKKDPPDMNGIKKVSFS